MLSAFLAFVFLIGCDEEQSAESLEVSEEAFDFLGVDGDGGSFMVTSNTNWTVTGSDDSWLKYNPASGSGNRGVMVSANYNQGQNIRTGAITVSTESGITRTVLISQLGTAPDIIVRPETVTALEGRDTIALRVTASHEWMVQIPDEVQNWISAVSAEETSFKGWARLAIDWNETDAERSAEITVKLKNFDKEVAISLSQPFIRLPEDIDYPNDAVIGQEFAITGKNLGSVGKVLYNDKEMAIVSKTGEKVSALVPSTTPEGSGELKIIYGSKEMILGTLNAVPPFPKVAEIPDEAAIGTAIILHGSLLNTVEKVFIGTAEATFEPGRTPSASMLITIPSTAKAGTVDLKFVFGGNENVVGAITLKDKVAGDPGIDLCRYAGSNATGVPKVVEGGRTNGFNVGGGRSVLFAFDGALDGASYDLVDYATLYAGVTGGGIPNRGRTYWQTNSGQNVGEVDDGAEIPKDRISFTLDYSNTEAGYVTFDKIVLYAREPNGVTQKHTVEISNNNLHWVKVVKAESTEPFPATNVAVTHQLSQLVTAKYVRYVCVEATAFNTGLMNFSLYCTK